MAKAKNAVIAGDFSGSKISYSSGRVKLNLSTFWIEISNETVKSYELITDEHRKSAMSGVARGIVGGALLGPVGILAGGLSAKSKGIYQIAIQFKDHPSASFGGKRCLIEVDDGIYKAIVKNCF